VRDNHKNEEEKLAIAAICPTLLPNLELTNDFPCGWVVTFVVPSRPEK